MSPEAAQQKRTETDKEFKSYFLRMSILGLHLDKMIGVGESAKFISENEKKELLNGRSHHLKSPQKSFLSWGGQPTNPWLFVGIYDGVGKIAVGQDTTKIEYTIARTSEPTCVLWERKPDGQWIDSTEIEGFGLVGWADLEEIISLAEKQNGITKS